MGADRNRDVLIRVRGQNLNASLNIFMGFMVLIFVGLRSFVLFVTQNSFFGSAAKFREGTKLHEVVTIGALAPLPNRHV